MDSAHKLYFINGLSGVSQDTILETQSPKDTSWLWARGQSLMIVMILMSEYVIYVCN